MKQCRTALNGVKLSKILQDIVLFTRGNISFEIVASLFLLWTTIFNKMSIPFYIYPDNVMNKTIYLIVLSALFGVLQLNPGKS